MNGSILLLTFLIVNCLCFNTTRILSDGFIDRINSQKSTWTAGRNFHKDSSLKNLFSVFKERKAKLAPGGSESMGKIPSDFDASTKWRKCKSIKEVFDQGNCASAWAVTVTSVFRDRLCIVNGSKVHVSAQYLMTCCSDCGQGCFGGFPDRALQYMQSHGLPLGGKYGGKGCRPYGAGACPSQDGTIFCPKVRQYTGWCYENKCVNDKIIRPYMLYKSKTSFAVPNDEKKIQSEILNFGPVLGVLTVYEDFFSYKSGVYKHIEGKRVGLQEVKIIGWGTDKNTKQEYWSIVNSWGSNWGENGKMKILRGSNECNLEDNIFSLRV